MSAPVRITLLGLCHEIVLIRARDLGATTRGIAGLCEALHDLVPHTRQTRAVATAAWVLEHSYDGAAAAWALMHADDVFDRDEWIARCALEIGVEVVS